ncbi:DUF4215 domain-containing protein [Myxococcota bacterium]|nr:DUF4215 domain-containing protein [Myxococcota bacterium]
MKRAPRWLLASLALVSCSSEPAPRIIEFAANPVSVFPGRSATLRYNVEGASSVKIDTREGLPVLPATEAPSGSVETGPLTQTTTYVLTADNRGTTTTRTLTVAVRTEAPPPATILTFTAMPAVVPPGGATTLSWTTMDAVRGELRVGRTTLADLLPEQLASGTYRVEGLDRATEYTLAVVGEDELEITRDLTVDVRVLGPIVRSFEAVPTTIIRGGRADLTWNVESATSLTITGNLSGIAYSGTLFSGSVSVAPQFSERYTLVARDGVNPDVVAEADVTVLPPPGARILRFTATPSSVVAGSEVTLSWAVENAAQGIAIEAGTTRIHASPDAEGSITLAPFASTAYTLRAYNAALGDDSATISVTVTESPGARIRAFSADRTTVTLGESIHVEWEVENAPEGIDISDATGFVAITSTLAAGSVEYFPATSTTLRLTAYNAALGNATTTLPITVAASAPAIAELRASPDPAPVGGPTTISWRALGADELVFYVDGAEHLRTTDGTGSFVLPMARQAREVALEATNALGTARSVLDVGVIGLPIVNQFSSLPKFSTQTNVRVELVWATDDATDVEIFVNGAPLVVGSLPQHGTQPGVLAGLAPVNVVGTQVIDFVARNAAGTVVVREALSILTPEVEPNDSFSAAIPLVGDGSGVTASIGVVGDEDWYSLTVGEGDSLYVEVSDGTLGHCNIDTLLTLYAPDGVTMLYEDDDGGELVFNDVGCSILDRKTDAAARNLAAGTYFVKVRNYPPSSFLTTQTGAYSLVAWVYPPACGDGVVDRGATPAEQCDDGNGVEGDGCSSACVIEPDRVLPGPRTSWEIPGEIDVMTEVDYFQLVVTEPSYLFAELSAPELGACFSADAKLTLYDAQLQVLGSDDDDGERECPSIDPARDAFAALVPGVYWLALQEDGDDDLVRGYVLTIDLPFIGCGNGMHEAGEVCDDGNTTSGDGCSATCTFEGAAEREAAGNDATTSSGVVTLPASGRGSGALGALGDRDYWAVTVPAGWHLDAHVTTSGYETCATTGPRARLALFDAQGRQLAVNDRDGPEGTCGRIAPETTRAAFAMAGGTYFLRVDEVGADATITGYYLHVDVVSPGCGNGLVDVGEQCDDGALADGDGCSATCTFEVEGTVVSGTGAIVSTTLGAAGQYTVIPVTTTLPGQAITVVAADPGGAACTLVDTALELRGPSFELLGAVTGGGPSGAAGECARIAVVSDAFATNLAVGTYYVVVIAESAAPEPIEADVEILDAACGNGVVETLAAEECDDDGTAAGDGCSATCRFEPFASITLPGGPQTITTSVDTVGMRRAFELVVTSEVFLRAETFAPTVIAGCDSADTILRLQTASGGTLGDDDDDGVGGCSRITPRDPFARLAAGRYLLTIGDFGDDAAIAQLALVVEGRAAGTCGNGVREAPEGCDDGGTTSGDGCSASCGLELAAAIVDAEPNGGPGSASQPLGTLTTGTIVDLEGSILAGGDEDWFSFTIAPGELATALVTTHALFNLTATCDFDSELWLYRGTPTDLSATSARVEPTLVGWDNNSGAGTCSQLSGTIDLPAPVILTAGTYLLRVRAYHGASAIPDYRVRIDLR